MGSQDRASISSFYRRLRLGRQQQRPCLVAANKQPFAPLNGKLDRYRTLPCLFLGAHSLLILSSHRDFIVSKTIVYPEKSVESTPCAQYWQASKRGQDTVSSLRRSAATVEHRR